MKNSSHMRAARLHPDGLVVEDVDVPELRPGEALVRVHAAGITRDELEWPVDRLPAIPSYELSGVVADTDEAVYALTPFDRDGVAAEYAVVAGELLAPKPRSLGHLATAALPLAGLSAWQGLFDHGGLQEGERVLIRGATGGVGQFATQLARLHGAHVIAQSSDAELARGLGAHDVVGYDDAPADVDLVFDTVGDPPRGARVVSVAAEAPGATYFVVEPNAAQLAELALLVDEGKVRPVLDSVFPLADARAAFERSMARGKRGKVVLQIGDD